MRSDPTEVNEDDPRAFQHSVRLYQAMWDSSKETLFDNVIVRMWEGSITELFNSLRISKTFYRTCTTSLERMGCVHRVSKGSRMRPSAFTLHRTPTLGDWSDLTNESLTRREDVAILARQMAEIRQMIGGMNVAAEITSLQQQIDSLKSRVENLEQSP